MTEKDDFQSNDNTNSSDSETMNLLIENSENFDEDTHNNNNCNYEVGTIYIKKVEYTWYLLLPVEAVF